MANVPSSTLGRLSQTGLKWNCTLLVWKILYPWIKQHPLNLINHSEDSRLRYSRCPYDDKGVSCITLSNGSKPTGPNTDQGLWLQVHNTIKCRVATMMAQWTWNSSHLIRTPTWNLTQITGISCWAAVPIFSQLVKNSCRYDCNNTEQFKKVATFTRTMSLFTYIVDMFVGLDKINTKFSQRSNTGVTEWVRDAALHLCRFGWLLHSPRLVSSNSRKNTYSDRVSIHCLSMWWRCCIMLVVTVVVMMTRSVLLWGLLMLSCHGYTEEPS